ncbi:MAG: hypothetical protein IJQ65_07370, partial [Kiritimatiellae bacterium]|nr:hypothetical protein [Kiritimatiellia bacterium]
MTTVNDIGRAALASAFAVLLHGDVMGAVPLTVYAQPEPVGLPPLMRTDAGVQIGNVREWETVRRPEILKFAIENIYGVRPVERPADLKFEQIEPDRAFPEVKAVRRRARACFSGPRGSWSFEIAAFVPSAASPSAKAPAFVLVCNRALEKFADIDLKTKSEFFPVEEIVARGYAVAVFKNTELALDEYPPYYAADGSVVIQDPPFTNGFYACWAAGRTERSWGAISAWAWGASRVLDWLETMPDVDAGHVAVVGHSRGGKTSLWAAASDRRFAMACVNDSGCCGAKLNHVAVPLSETIQLDNNNNPHWFCRAYRQFNCRDMQLPFDQHWIAALVAPRLLYIASASYDYPAGPWGEFLTARHASPAWELYGKKGLVEDHIYGVAMPFHSGCIGYHLRQGKHDLNLYDWRNYIDFADRHGWRGVPRPARVDIPAQTFDAGGWGLDVQFMDVMGSPYLIAHGKGIPVTDARAVVDVPEDGAWRVWVRARKWVDGAGAFKVRVNGEELARTFGASQAEWAWEDGGEVRLCRGRAEVRLVDTDGFDGRCAGVVLSKGGEAPTAPLAPE